MADTTLSQYIYSSLGEQQIRLLHALHTPENAYELIDVDLSSANEYMAISYSWENQERNQRMLIGTTSSAAQSFVLVTQTVHTALHRISEKYPQSYIWIDGICINQDDVLEKQHQIPLMCDIYTNAERGVIWLGELDDTLEAGFDGIPVILRVTQGGEGRMSEKTWNSLGLPSHSSPVWDGLKELFTLPWWTRTWTIQETILPIRLEILCGNVTLEWSLLQALIETLLDNYLDYYLYDVRSGRVTFPRIEHLIRLRSLFQTGANGGIPLTSLIEISTLRHASNPLDKIYGLLGLAPSYVLEKLTVDYKRTPSELYVRFAKLYIAMDPGPYLPEYAPAEEPLLGVPSWCPNFGCLSILDRFDIADTSFCAGIMEKDIRTPKPTCIADSNALRCQGFKVDQVRAVASSRYVPWWEQEPLSLPAVAATILHTPLASSKYVPWWEQEPLINPPMVAATILAWEEECLKLSQEACNTAAIPKEHWKCLVADHVDRKRTTEETVQAYELFKNWLRADCAVDETLPLAKDVKDHKRDAYFASMGRACDGRRFFSTKGGRVGLGPLAIKPGDDVCVLLNGPIPFIFRNKEGKGTFEHVGHAYVHGIMYGEALEQHSGKETVFVLE